MNKVFLIVTTLLAVPVALAHDPAGTYKTYCEPQGEWSVHEYGAPATGVLVDGYEDGNLADCDGVFPPLYDYDGHAEYARGGAWILVTSGNGEPSPDPTVGAGTVYCYGDEGHHAEFGPVTVTDVVLGAGATFTVASDTVDLTGVGEGCGDFESDEGVDCVGTCTPTEITFPAGLDGSYQVYVQGTLGHVVW